MFINGLTMHLPWLRLKSWEKNNVMNGVFDEGHTVCHGVVSNYDVSLTLKIYLCHSKQLVARLGFFQ